MTKIKKSFLLAVLPLLASIFLWTAGAETASAALATISITPANPVLLQGTTLQLNAQTFDELGNPISAPVTWSSNNTAVSGITFQFGQLAIINALSEGQATITARNGNITGTTTVTVIFSDPVLTSISVIPVISAITIGESQQFTAIALDQSRNPLAVQPEFTWASSNEAVGTVDQSGLFTALAEGSSAITAASGGIISRGAAINVIPPPPPEPIISEVVVNPATADVIAGSTLEFSAVAFDQFGISMDPQPQFAWASSDNAIGTIESTGVITALFTAVSQGGPITITAAAGGISATASVNVTTSTPPSSSATSFSCPDNYSCRAGNIKHRNWSNSTVFGNRIRPVFKSNPNRHNMAN